MRGAGPAPGTPSVDPHTAHPGLGGGLPPQPADRAPLVWQTDNPALVEEFAHADPYVREGLVVSWSIRPWNVVVAG